MRPLPTGMKLTLKERKKYIRLDWNESPFKPPKNVVRALKKISNRVNEYPNVTLDNLKENIAKLFKNIDKTNIELFSGSDGALSYAFMALREYSKVFYTTPNYGYIERFLKRTGQKSNILESFSPSLDTIKKCMTEFTPDIVYISTPMAQVGASYNIKELYDFIKENSSFYFIIDETYADFCGKTIIKYPLLNNMIVARSFSKSHCLAGLRIGYAIAKPELIEEMTDMRDLEHINIMAQVGLTEMLKNNSFSNWNVKKINSLRDEFVKKINAVGIKAVNTKTNFFLIEEENSSELVKFLEKMKILVRDIPDWKGKIRVTVGKRKSLELLLKGLIEWKDQK
jgi:histidinol-phosphate aminotransferase